jgi:murein DD-endopeptidase MepM/ murein hydrolase activator NlpD
MARLPRIAATVVCAGILLGAQTAAPSGGASEGMTTAMAPVAPTPTPASEAAVAFEGIADRTDAAETELADVQASIDQIQWTLGSLEMDVRAPDTTVEAGRERLHRQSDAARAQVEAFAPARPSSPSIEELTQTLQSIAEALAANDQYRGTLLSNEGELFRLRDRLERLSADIRSARFALEGKLAALRADLAAASQVVWNSTGEISPVIADDVTQRIRGLIGRAQVAQLGLREKEARVAALTAALSAEQAQFDEGMRAADQERDDLYEQMVATEGALSGYVGDLFGTGWSGQVFDGEVLQVCPVDPPNAYSDDFGAPRYAGGYHPHQGNDVFAPEGTPIRAPFAGNAVDRSNTLGGMAVSVYGAHGYVYNAHLSAFGQLGPVEAGDIIGYVGNTGDAIHTAPHDHFEWHPDNGSAVDPFVYLNAVCRPPASD